MNPLKRWRLKNQLRIAARLNATGDLTDAYYGALATHVMFELAGHVLKDGDNISPLDLELAVPKALGLLTAYQWDSPELEREYGQYQRAAMYVKNAMGDYVWGTVAEELYKTTLPLVMLLPRFETRIARLRKTYPNITGVGAWLGSLIIAGLIGAIITRLLTCPR